jgi:hypothetical protein
VSPLTGDRELEAILARHTPPIESGSQSSLDPARWRTGAGEHFRRRGLGALRDAPVKNQRFTEMDTHRVEALIEPENDASRALAANRPVTPMTRNSQRPAFVLVADLPQKSGPYTEPPPVARLWAVFVFDRASLHSRFA